MFAAYQRYFDFQGRSSRSEFWLFMLWLVILDAVAVAIDVFAFGTNPMQPYGMYGPAFIVVNGANLIPNLAMQVRRLHDIDRTGWWTLASVVPFLGLVVFVFDLWPGTDGSNRFGPRHVRGAETLQETFA